MPDAELSLALLFDAGAAGERTAHDVYADAIQQAKAFKTVVAAAKIGLPQIHWRAAAEEVARRLRELLDVPLPRVLVNGWKLRKEMTSYCNRAEYPPDRSVTVKLAEHSISWSQKPQVHVRLNGAPIGALEFAIEAKVTLELATATIRDGHVVAVNAGKIAVEGSVTLEDYAIIEKHLLDLPIPGRLALGDGIPLCSADAPSYTPAHDRHPSGVRPL